MSDVDALSIDELAAAFLGESPPYHRLEDLLLQQELLLPPPVVLPRLAWEARITLLAAREKAGKSTLIGQAVAALVEGQTFLGEQVRKSKVLWFALDEPMGDLVRRLADYGATGWVAVMTERPPLSVIEETITEYGASLVVIDTLLEYGACDVEDTFSARQWQPVFKTLRGIGERTKAAIVVLHHSKKSSGEYRDSTQIGAGVDAIVTMHESESDSTLRRCKYRGRLRGEDFAIRFLDGRYELDSGSPTLEMRVLTAIAANPGIGSGALRSVVGGKARDVDAAVRDLLTRKAIQDRGTGKGHHYVVRPPNALSQRPIPIGPGQGSGQAPQLDAGQGGTGLGQGRDRGPVPPIQSIGGDSPGAPEDLLELIEAASRGAT